MRTRPHHMLPLIVLAGCMEYGLWGNTKGDGETGWDFHWDDGSGTTSTCWEGLSMPPDVSLDESCQIVQNVGSLPATLEWQTVSFMQYPEYSDILMMPAVGHLLDDDGDGILNGPGDIPEIVVVNDFMQGDSDSGVLRILRGSDGAELVVLNHIDQGDTQWHPDRYSNVSLGDIDGDGLPEIVVVLRGLQTSTPDSGDDSGSGSDTSAPIPGPSVLPPAMPVASPGPLECRLAALSNDGHLKWIAESELECTGHSPAIADLEGDGTVEVVIGNSVVEGLDGQVRFVGEGGKGYYPAIVQAGFQSFPDDLDGDGFQEILAGATIFNYDGTIHCNIDETFNDGFPAAADLDGDGRGEFVLSGNNTLRVFNDDCTYLAGWETEGDGNGGPPTIADFDGDGRPEIGVSNADYYMVYEYGGQLLWANPISDHSSHCTGSSVFDFDGDGRSEVVFADETTLWVFDGVTGESRLQWPHSSRTLHEYPVVVDVDADGMTEIVVPNGGGHYDDEYRGIYVLGSAYNEWVTNRQVWNQHAYSITNINDDLSVPAHPVPNWPTYNNFRSGNVETRPGEVLPDAVPAGSAICTNKCAIGQIALILGMGNSGMTELPPGVPISLWSVVGGARFYLDTVLSSASVPSGGTTQIHLMLDATRVPDGIIDIVVDDNRGVGILTECNEENNALRVDDVFCPVETGI